VTPGEALEGALARLSAERREFLRQLDEAAALAREAVRAFEAGSVDLARAAAERGCDLELAATRAEAPDALGPLLDYFDDHPKPPAAPVLPN